MLFLEKIINLVDRLCRYLLIFLMLEITAVISLGVISRYFLNSPIYWAEEVTRYSFVWATFLGAGCAYRRKELIAMTVMVNALSKRGQLIVGIVLELLICCFLVTALYYGVKMTYVVAPQLAVSTRVSMGWLYSIVPFSCGFMLLCCFENISELFLQIRGKAESMESKS